MVKRIGDLLRRQTPSQAALGFDVMGEEQQALLLLRDYEASGQGWFWSTDRAGKITYISENVANAIGCERSALLGSPFHALFSVERDENDEGSRTLPLILSGNKTFSDLPVRPAAATSELLWTITGRPQFDGDNNFLGYRGSGVDATERLRSQRDASRLAMYDSLTGLFNRHRMGQRLVTILQAYAATQRCCAVMMIDLDRFKQVNDTLGHQAGDELLKQVAQRLQRVCDKTAEIGRLGGDEFQILLPNIDDRGRLGEMAKRIIAIISQPYSINGSRCVIGTSVGIAISPFDGSNSEELIRSADLALYAAKGGGRGQFRFYSSELHESAEKRRRLEEDLRDALTNDQIRLKYQPIVSAKNDTVIGVEALMRWVHPEFGDVSPAVFIPIAEESNLIIALGEWALRQACTEAMTWPGNIRVAVNVSPAQFAHPNFITSVTQAISHSGIAPERLEIELTESIFVNDDETTDGNFAALKRLGVRLALDDFGTGYSSLGYLKKAPFDKIKIDKGFIRDVTVPGSRNPAIITAIVSLAKALDMVTTAEGIEARDELALMRELGVDQIQGYIYSAARPVEEVSEVLASGAWVIEPQGPDKQRAERRTVLRRVGVIHEDHRYEVMMRNLSRSGAGIEGLLGVPIGTEFVLDLGEGQLAVATVRRSEGQHQGLEFETPLVDDGAGGLCTRHRVAPHILAAMGMPTGSTGGAVVQLNSMAQVSLPRFGTVDPTRNSRFG
ncbi:EAL domain-containing protein [Novosphingobium piscinae]|uniref:EAL domain-containing protein n=1 Tax=Novosphingobium piscinae TaxID=1507448 RepID=A0A7X1FXX4_9SPHN|nr:EAL domain-containing protein [Novosphingobium piscinae]